MKVKLDENLPTRLAAILRTHGHEVDTVPEGQLSGAPDYQVWQAAAHGGRFLVAQDLDFSHSRRLAPGTRAGLLLVRLPCPIHAPRRKRCAPRLPG
jgi:predicted nuclease of predicted toxin-antitoxin system